MKLIWVGKLCLKILLCVLFLSLWACGSKRHVCPALPTQGDLLAGEIDTSYCCQALAVCCKEVPAGEDKKKCDEDVVQGAKISCQARYYSLLSFEKCNPVYVSEYPNWNPKEVVR